MRQGKHLPQDSSAKNSIATRVSSTMSRVSSYTMMPAAPSIELRLRSEGSSNVTSKSFADRKPPDSPAMLAAWKPVPDGGPPAHSYRSSDRGKPKGTS